MDGGPEGVLTDATASDVELLRVVGRAATLHLDRLVGEGLRGQTIENVAAHALALTAETFIRQPQRLRTHAHGLRELLSELSGPMSAVLLRWLDEALGPRL